MRPANQRRRAPLHVRHASMRAFETFATNEHVRISENCRSDYGGDNLISVISRANISYVFFRTERNGHIVFDIYERLSLFIVTVFLSLCASLSLTLYLPRERYF